MEPLSKTLNFLLREVWITFSIQTQLSIFKKQNKITQLIAFRTIMKD
jgi:hypothetical protein